MKQVKDLLWKLLTVLVIISVMVGTTTVVKAKTRNYVKSIKVKKSTVVTIPASKNDVTKSFKVKVTVKGKASKKFVAKSSDKNIATVKVKGKYIKVTAKKAGTVKIKLTTKGKGKKKKKLSKTLTITVNKERMAARKKAYIPRGEIDESGIH